MPATVSALDAQHQASLGTPHSVLRPQLTPGMLASHGWPGSLHDPTRDGACWPRALRRLGETVLNTYYSGMTESETSARA